MSRASILEDFRRNTQQHRMTVVLDNGLHRHLSFRKVDSGAYSFDIVTWPGHLAITGDMGASVFCRLPDMFAFFRTTPEHHERAGGLCINPPYWAEKLVANQGEPKALYPDKFRACLQALFNQFIEAESFSEDGEQGSKPDWADELWGEIEVQVLGASSTDEAIRAMYEFEPSDERFKTFRMEEAWEHQSLIEDYTFHFLWRLCAIAHAVRAYDDWKVAVEPAGAAA